MRCVVEAINIWPHHTHVVLLRDGDQFVLQRLFTDLGEARRDHHRPGNFFPAHLVHRRSAKFRRNREYRHVDFIGNIEHAGIGLAPENFIRLWMNREDRPLVTAVDEIFHHRVADFAVFRGGADHCHGAGIHDPLHGAENFALAVALARLRFFAQNHAHVDGARVLLRRKNRIQIDFMNLREIIYQL